MKNSGSNHVFSFLLTTCLKIVLLLSLLFIADFSFSQNSNQNKVTQIRQQMAKIRQTTNWDNPEEAKKANEKIKELMKQLAAATTAPSQNQSGSNNNNQDTDDGSNEDGNKMNELQMEMMKHKVDVYTQIWGAGSSGKSAPVLLAKPLREEIVQEFKDDESPTASNTDYLDEKKILVIDLSSPTAQLLIDQMEHYKSIKTLVVTGGKNGAAVNLNDILAKAAAYPLEELYIINFRYFVKTVPAKIGTFKNLNLLALYNNQIEHLPAQISSLQFLKKLYIDMNPVQTLEPVLNSLIHLDTLGIAKTNIPETEISRLLQLNKNCQILTK